MVVLQKCVLVDQGDLTDDPWRNVMPGGDRGNRCPERKRQGIPSRAPLVLQKCVLADQGDLPDTLDETLGQGGQLGGTGTSFQESTQTHSFTTAPVSTSSPGAPGEKATERP